MKEYICNAINNDIVFCALIIIRARLIQNWPMLITNLN